LARFSVLVPALALALVSGGAAADPGHGDDDHEIGHGAARTRGSVTAGFAVVGRARLDGPTGDLAFFDHGATTGPYVYLGGARGGPGCPAGVRIVSVRNPRAPHVVATAGGIPGVTYEDVEVRRIGRRVVLAAGIQQCAENAAQGLALYDVTRPARPRRLAFWRSPGRGVHELDVVVRRDGRALALAATPHSERDSLRLGRDLGGDFRVIDISDPRRPEQLAEWGIVADSRLDQSGAGGEIASTGAGIGGYAVYYGHSVRGADRGRTAYVSYWDAGVLKFDLRDPRKPRLVARTAVPRDGEGDAHSVAVLDTGRRRFLIQSQEEVDPLSPPIVTTTATGDAHLPAVELPWAPRLLTDLGVITAAVFDAGAGCSAADYVGASSKLVLVDALDPAQAVRQAPCDVGEQALLAGRAGAMGLLVNFVSPDRPTIFRFVPAQAYLGPLRNQASQLFAVAISSIDGGAAALRASLRDGTPVQATLVPQRPGFGGLTVFDERGARPAADGTPTFRPAATFTDVAGTVGPVRRGPLSGVTEWVNAHNVELRGRRAYASWYAGGIVSLDVSSPTRIRRMGQFAPTGATFWGVDVDPKGSLVFASDIVGGLWILRPTR
jgi:hypothetical protein